MLTILVGPARVWQLDFTGISHVPQSQKKAGSRVDSKQIHEESGDPERRLLELESTRLAGSRAKFRRIRRVYADKNQDEVKSDFVTDGSREVKGNESGEGLSGSS